MSNEQQTPSKDNADNADNVADATTPADDDTEVEGFAGYIKFDGIDGEFRDGDHDKWVDVLNASTAVVQPGLPTIGGLGIKRP
jgi:hypothetical protein